MVATPSIPRIDLSGSSYEIGLQHGRLLRSQIQSQLTVYHSIFKALSGLSWPKVLEFAEAFQPTIQRLAPELYSEMEGIAQGAGVPLIEIVALNSRSEIALGTLDDGCTSLAWTLEDSQRNGSRRQILAQNWDWTEDVGKNLAKASITQPGVPKIWMVIEPGIVGKIGFNSSSVGVCLNAIRARSISTSLLPIHLLLRIALQCTSVDHAISEIERLGGPASSQHILIADSKSGGRGLEVSPLGSVCLPPDANGVVVHTNHFLENRHVEEIPWNIGSETRLTRIRELVSQILSDNPKCDSITPKLLRKRIFSDTQGAPQAICCYRPGTETDGRAISTLFNIVMQFAPGKEPTAEVLLGRPGPDNNGPVYRMPW
ncbi:acyl-CoA:6-aminopenicillanic-acid-acyltransferase [Fomitiporia mediterranea MF3/22]|uniref:acyl-CoA:6-aminopenicillanic-acid- acyltransferase n=1 Tax=Fomitiporia mediterranea (strain MF3/22) TaxID=694068 RepID=UPI00044095C3|nr:acyl-CoA:6-aminopenicillanic-acid-acyltransferase [Fomitiporia mediterranea MF3/22]EJD00494.1 acyl-CoA:6-aminopenicillanic-acid-acyltransferase [Fomitiporia mediterranea MF3/22]